MYLTLAGEAIVNGASLSDVMTSQLLRFQYPSPYSLGRSVDLSPRFRIRPFRFLLRLMADPHLGYLTEKEISLIVIEEAENESESCYEKVRNYILSYREKGIESLPSETEYLNAYYPKGTPREGVPYAYFLDIGNTLVNYLEITQMIRRIKYSDEKETQIEIAPDRIQEGEFLLHNGSPFIDRPNEQEYFQRKFGIDPKHHKDTRDLEHSQVITLRQIQEAKIGRFFITKSLSTPIYWIDDDIIHEVSEESSIDYQTVSDVLNRLYPQGAPNGFMNEYYRMAFSGRDEAIQFEIATTNLFREVFHFDAIHLGQGGRVPDVLIHFPSDGWQAIFDNKAYSAYSVSHDHENRMRYTYVPKIQSYSEFKDAPLAFFSYIAGGFGKNIEANIHTLHEGTGVNGSAATVSTIMKMVDMVQNGHKVLSHQTIKEMFSCNGLVRLPEK